MSIRWIKPLYVVAGLYDGILGFAFLIAPDAIFRTFHIEAPNHMGYVQFPALLLIVFAAMFFRIAGNPVARRELILYGIGLKISYVGTVLWYRFTIGIPSMWVPWAWMDLGFLLLFVMAWKATNEDKITAAKG